MQGQVWVVQSLLPAWLLVLAASELQVLAAWPLLLLQLPSELPAQLQGHHNPIRSCDAGTMPFLDEKKTS